MSEEHQNVNSVPPETAPAAPAQPAQVQPASTMTDKTGGKTYTSDEMEQIIKERLDREKARSEKAKEEAARRAAEAEAMKNAEWQKLAEQREKDLAEMKAEIARRDHAALQAKVAKAVGLPDALASRLIGEDEKALTEDAKALLETLPKPPPPPDPQKRQPGFAPTNPGANGSNAASVQEQRDRIYGARVDPWSVSANQNQGGGAFYRSKGDE